jgi:hypothetical protein
MHDAACNGLREVTYGSWLCKNVLSGRPVPGARMRPQAAIAAISGLIPTMFMTRVRL